ncbi:hypothetical protein PCANC_03983 [Puccinia coronata f. sp. avenae]|uniref:Uncharacterized protein n=1 Tax=Puccinia coronata f. sp. avenae TaxID=200324 RepID=A0A2N5T7S5_9BASI|nr:hypothetical protein PCANC_03983 [Puccinia coronata f. sp. avenae]
MIGVRTPFGRAAIKPPFISSLVQPPTTIRPYTYKYLFHPLRVNLDLPLFDLTAAPRIPYLESPVFNPVDLFCFDRDLLPILSANCAMIDSSWFNSPPAAWSTDQGFLPNTPSPITVEHPQPEVKPLYKFEDLDELAPAAPHATYPFTDLIPFDSLTPFGLYNPSSYH